MSPELAGGFLTTAPPGKPANLFLIRKAAAPVLLGNPEESSLFSLTSQIRSIKILILDITIIFREFAMCSSGLNT